MFIEDIATAYPKRVELVYDELRFLINTGLLPNYHLDMDCKKIVFSPKTEDPIKEADKPPKVNSNGNKKFISAPNKSDVIKCQNCGGVNRLSGGKGDCDYCGSPLA